MKHANDTPTASASTQDPDSERELSDSELETAAGGTIRPVSTILIPTEDPIVVTSPTPNILQTNV